jgi:uncharacterized protein YndB with AHSA1/START domain
VPPPGGTTPSAPPPRSLPHPGVLVAAVATGVAYGLVFRVVFGLNRFEDVFGVMTIGFLFFVPAALGYVTVAVGERHGPWGWASRILAPVGTALVALFAALVLAWEGLICIVLWLPLTTVMALIGGLLATAVGALVRRRRAQAMVACLVGLIPLAVAPAERRLPSPDEIRTVHTSIDIAADPAVVWRAISRVRRFEEGEHRFSWSHLAGFPLPVEATLDREGVGGVRHASFEGGVVFVERVTTWEPERRLAFTVHADPDAIPMRTLDQHVTVGGEFFDVLEGEYRIEPLGSRTLRLHLASRHRVSTRFNAYARLWTDWVMTDIQRYILARLEERCERGQP